MKLIYNVKDKPKFSQTLVFAFQQLLAIMAATIAVPAQVAKVDNVETGLTAAAALLGAGIGTLVYQLFTRFRSPVFLGSSFAFIGPMIAAFSGAYANVMLGYTGLLLGAVFAGLVYVAIAIAVKFAGTNWISKIMPPVVIGPIVATIGLSLSGYAVTLVQTGDVTGEGDKMLASPNIALICALVTLLAVVISSIYGKKMAKLIPFIIGILAGYLVAVIFTVIGNAAGIDSLKVINFAPFKALVADGVKFSTFISMPNLIFVDAFKGIKDLTGAYVAKIAVAYIPVAFVVFAEHLADHKHLSYIIEKDLTKDPGLDKTLLGDGVGSIAGTFFGGCPNTTYGESIACVAITKNASVVSVTLASFLSIAVAFISPFVAFLQSIPSCVMGGVCLTLYGFIAVSGLKMLQPVDLGDNRNLFTASVILIIGTGGLLVNFGQIQLRTVACALILGVIVNLIANARKDKTEKDGGEVAEATTEEESEETTDKKD